MYSFWSRGVLRYMFLISAPPNFAPGLLITLFHIIFADTMSAVPAVSLYGNQ